MCTESLSSIIHSLSAFPFVSLSDSRHVALRNTILTSLLVPTDGGSKPHFCPPTSSVFCRREHTFGCSTRRSTPRFSTATVPHRMSPAKPRVSVVFTPHPPLLPPPLQSYASTRHFPLLHINGKVATPPDSCKRPQCHLHVVLTLSSFCVFDARSLYSERALSVSWFSSVDLLRF